ncbi:MAG: hypothetical protein ACO3R4_04255 [Litorivicinaceae bacterium]
MLIAHVLMMLIPGLPTPVSTSQIFASEAACEVARAAMAAHDPVNQYTCLASPESTPNR